MNMVLAILFGLLALGVSVIFLVEMFQDAVWKGIVGLLCGLYMLYYILFESEHEHKWLLLICQLACSALAQFFLRNLN